MSTEDPRPPYRFLGYDETVEIAGVKLRRTNLLHLHPGDCQFDDTWMTNKPIRLEIVWVGGTSMIDGVEHVLIEGTQIVPGHFDNGRYRAVMVRVDALARALDPQHRTRTGEPRQSPAPANRAKAFGPVAPNQREVPPWKSAE